MPLKAIKTDALDFYTFFTGVQLEGGRLLLPFFGNQKKVPQILEKKTLIVSILMLNLPFKM